jgi:plastocyanin
VTADPGRAFDASRVRLPDGASTFDSGDVAPGEVFEYTFTVAGEYRYICVPHELTGMLGVVMVEG